MKSFFSVFGGIFLLVMINGCSNEGEITMKKNAVLLDVRTPEEHKEGYLDGALLLPLAELESKISGEVPEKTTPIYIYCRSGRRAGTAVEKLTHLGYTDLHNLGGLRDAQEKCNLPIKR